MKFAAKILLVAGLGFWCASYGQVPGGGAMPVGATTTVVSVANEAVAVKPAVSVSDIKITFAQTQIAPPFGIPPEAESAGVEADPPSTINGTTQFRSGVVKNPREYGALSSIGAGQIAALTVTWADPRSFKTEDQVEDFLRELLRNQNEVNYTYHAWSYPDGFPCLAATVEHADGKPGRWLVWSSPNLAWAYLDGKGRWWFGQWNGRGSKTPKPKNLEI